MYYLLQHVRIRRARGICDERRAGRFTFTWPSLNCFSLIIGAAKDICTDTRLVHSVSVFLVRFDFPSRSFPSVRFFLRGCNKSDKGRGLGAMTVHCVLGWRSILCWRRIRCARDKSPRRTECIALKALGPSTKPPPAQPPRRAKVGEKLCTKDARFGQITFRVTYATCEVFPPARWSISTIVMTNSTCRSSRDRGGKTLRNYIGYNVYIMHHSYAIPRHQSIKKIYV